MKCARAFVIVTINYVETDQNTVQKPFKPLFFKISKIIIVNHGKKYQETMLTLKGSLFDEFRLYSVNTA